MSDAAEKARSAEAAFLQVALRRAVERSSIRDVAQRSGLSHGSVHKIITGGTTRTYGTTLRKLRTWYLQEWAAGGDGLTPDIAAFLIGQVLATVPPGEERRSAVLELVQALEGIFRSFGAPRPAWLGAITMDPGTVDGSTA